MHHLAVKAEEWDEPGVREGIYTASMIYMRQRGNESRGSKLNSSETVRRECGEAMGKAAQCMWTSIDAREWYHAMELKIFKHAFASPFEMMEMLMAINDGKKHNIASE